MSLPAAPLAVQAEEPGELPPAALEPAVAPASGLRHRAVQAARAVSGRLSYALADQVVYSFGNMVVAALLSRHAGAREFGMYILTQRSMDLLVQLCNTLSWAPFTFNLAGTPADRQRTYRGSALLQQIAACVFAVALLAAAAWWAATPARGVYYGTFHPLLVPASAILFREFNRRMYFADLRMREAFWTEVATVVLQVAGVEWLYRSHRLDVPHTLLVLGFGAGAVSLWWIAREWRTVSLRLRSFLDDTRLNLRLGRWFLGSNMVFLASAQANPWLLSATLGGGSVGAYAVCEAVVNIPRVALVSLQNVFAPMLARAVAEGGKSRLRAVVRRLDRTLFLGSVLCAMLLVLAGPWVAHLIFKHVPGNARLILLVLSLNFVAFASTLAQSYALSAIDRAGPTFYANVAGLAAQAATAVWLVHTLAIPGAALAMLLGSVVVLLVRQGFYRQEMAA